MLKQPGNNSVESPPCAFIFMEKADGDSVVPTLDEAFLSALKVADPQGLTETRVYRGGILLARLAYKPEVITAKQRTQKKSANPGYLQIGTTEVADKDLYAILVGDFVETCLEQWNTIDAPRFWEQVAYNSLDATVVSSISEQVAMSIDGLLRKHPRYIGAVEPDLGNPLHLDLFVESMFKDAFIRDGRVFVRADFDGEYNGSFFGADAFSPGGEVVLPYEHFENSAPAPRFPDALSARGLVTDMRLRTRMALSTHQKLLSAMKRGVTLRQISVPFEWDLSQLPDAPEEVNVQARKLTEYLLNPEHENGNSKARFFEVELGITRDNWRFLHAQLVDGLAHVAYEEIRLSQYGIRFSAELSVKGLNDVCATIKTAWIVRSRERASLVTAFPGKRRDIVESQLTELYIVPSEIQGEARWQAIYDLADEAGRRAIAVCVPRPMIVEGNVYMDGECGLAFIVIKDGRRSFVRWLKKMNYGDRHWPSGWSISAPRNGQSAGSAKAYADAFVRVLRRNGIECYAETHLT
ncbi:DUF6883 domain-containing protein [Thiohalobacter thiocyanaticus]|uniref:DUF6883 domain-containing protein n=1 Tax=Thiohalobacter thiocyanaticus TaxID=585455 RepID=A0A426QL02_9GAMM|nr:DUF6883 domain-containing protein [Thiohalobacter thiocyanaticus]RRQ22445.1 hypothetical protein D6C00_11165 [Thiohalobacter thiocyanaticus]